MELTPKQQEGLKNISCYAQLDKTAEIKSFYFDI